MVVQDRLITVEEFQASIAQHPDRRFELVHGRLWKKCPPKNTASLSYEFGSRILFHSDMHALARAGVEARHCPGEDRHNDRLPDVACTRPERALPVQRIFEI